MKLLDLSHSLENGMPYYPGTESPSFTNAFTIEVQGFRETRLNLLSHIGTHLDAPAHIQNRGADLDDFEIAQFTGKAYAIDVSHCKESICLEDIKHCEKDLRETDFILLYTGWSKYWGEAAYFSNYPVLDSTAAVYLSQMNLKGIGLDTVSIDAPGVQQLINHGIILKKNILIIENLNIPKELAGKFFEFYAFPLKIKAGDGSPVRAVAKV